MKIEASRIFSLALLNSLFSVARMFGRNVHNRQKLLPVSIVRPYHSRRDTGVISSLDDTDFSVTKSDGHTFPWSVTIRIALCRTKCILGDLLLSLNARSA